MSTADPPVTLRVRRPWRPLVEVMVASTVVMAGAWCLEFWLFAELQRLGRASGFVSPVHFAGVALAILAVPVTVGGLLLGANLEAAAATEARPGWRSCVLRSALWNAFLGPCWWSPFLFVVGWSAQYMRPVPVHSIAPEPGPVLQSVWGLMAGLPGLALALVAGACMIGTAVRTAAGAGVVRWTRPRTLIAVGVAVFVVAVLVATAAYGMMMAMELTEASSVPDEIGSTHLVFPLTGAVIAQILFGAACCAGIFGLVARMLVRAAIPLPAAPPETPAVLRRAWDVAPTDTQVVVPDRHTVSVVLMPGQRAGWWIQLAGAGALGIASMHSPGADVRLAIATATGVPGTLAPVPSYPGAFHLQPPVPGWWHLAGTNFSSVATTLTLELDLPPGSTIRPDGIPGRSVA